MKYHVPQFILFIAIFTTYSTNGMLEPSLGIIEKQIFSQKINLIGRITALPKTEIPYSLIITKIVDPYAQDSFSQLVMETIKKKEQREKYLLTRNNILEPHTRYWYKQAQDRPYIELIVTLTLQDSLLLLNKE